MSGPRSRPPGAASSLSDDKELSRKEAAEYIASLLEGLMLVAHNAQLQLLAYFDERDELLAVALQPPGKIEFQQDNVHLRVSSPVVRISSSISGWGRGRR
jgi:hypothetical protein